MKYNNTVVKKMNFNGQKVKKWYHNGVKVFSSGNIVTYNVDTGTSYKEEVDSEATVLSPKTFTPTKSGWTFVGWRTDKTASSSVISSMTMGDDPITLYAVFKRTLTTTFSGNGATSGSVSAIYATQYYNNGNYNNPTITLPSNGFSRTDYAFTGWNLGDVGAKVTISGNTTVYAQWRQTIVRLVQNSKAVNGRLYVTEVRSSDEYAWSSDNVSYTGKGDGGDYGEDNGWSQSARGYYNAVIPAGKTVHITVNVTSNNYECHLWKTSIAFMRVPSSGNISSGSNAYSFISDFISADNGNSNNTKDITYTWSYSEAWRPAFQFEPAEYGTLGRVVKFTIKDMYYEV